MKAMIFAAGLGTRLKPLTDSMPKALLPLAGKTLLQWQIELLQQAGIQDIIINVHHFPDQIIDYLQEHHNFGCHITISDERDLLLETGGGLRKALSLLDHPEEPILACNVDILSNIDINDLITRFEQTGISQLVVSERTTQRYLCFGNDGLLQGWTNIATGELKGTDGKQLAFSGMQILNKEVLSRLQQVPEDKFSLISFYLDIMHSTPLQAYVPHNYRMMDVGKIAQLHEAEAFATDLFKA